MTRALPARLALLSLAFASSWADAAPKKYHFNLAAVTAKPEVKPELAATATPRIKAQVEKTFETHPQLVGKLEGAPDWKTQPEAYRKFLAKRGVASAYHVTVEVTEAGASIEPMPDKPNTQRLVVRLAIHMLGETMPGRTMGFTGDGSATVKQEVGMKLRDRDRTFAWDSVAEAAIAEAMLTVMKQLALPKVKP